MKTGLLHEQRGVMLLEALIGLLIFSIGILAMIGMQAVSIRATAAATYRSEAAYLANQIINMMWVESRDVLSNPTNAYNLASYQLNAPVAAGACSTGANPVPANPNVKRWLQNDVSRLPRWNQFQQQIAVDANNVVTVRLCWLSPGEIGNAHQFIVTAQIR